MKIVYSNTNACWFQVESPQVEEEMIEVESQDENLLKTEWEKDPIDTQEYRKVTFTLTII